jgi:hypothetical protein
MIKSHLLEKVYKKNYANKLKLILILVFMLCDTTNSAQTWEMCCSAL